MKQEKSPAEVAKTGFLASENGRWVAKSPNPHFHQLVSF
jgi:hypothetical protein